MTNINKYNWAMQKKTKLMIKCQTLTKLRNFRELYKEIMFSGVVVPERFCLGTFLSDGGFGEV